jgi:trans-aconitate 2-methyltransferase
VSWDPGQCLEFAGERLRPAVDLLARAEHPQAQFVQADIGRWRPAAPVALIYSNAALHWLADHDAVIIAALFASLATGGVLAVQMPRNFRAPSHTAIVETIEQGPWRAQLEPFLRRDPVAEPGHYWRPLKDRAAALEIWGTEYLQVLSGENPVAEYTKGTWLKQFLDRLDAPGRAAFEADYRRRVAAWYPPQADGRTLFPFRRLFIVAQRGS